MLNEFGIQIREADKFILIQIHHEELIGGSQINFLRREKLVKVRDVFAMFL